MNNTEPRGRLVPTLMVMDVVCAAVMVTPPPLHRFLWLLGRGAASAESH